MLDFFAQDVQFFIVVLTVKFNGILEIKKITTAVSATRLLM